MPSTAASVRTRGGTKHLRPAAPSDQSVLRGDVPLRDMVALAESDLKFTIVLFTKCQACGTTCFYGLCIRGQPTYKPTRGGTENEWPWSEVPERELWAR